MNATGVDLTFVGYSAYWKDSGLPVAHTFSNVGGVLTFDNFPIIPATDQIVIEITVVLEDTAVKRAGYPVRSTPRNGISAVSLTVPSTSHLPGEWGISEPLTIAAPELIMTKTGPATLGRTLNLGEWGTFGLDVQNTGLGDAWDTTLIDILPDGATGGMCDATPEVLSAQIFATLTVSPALIAGKGPLNGGPRLHAELRRRSVLHACRCQC